MSKHFIRALKLVVGFYVSLLLIFVAFQRSLIYAPTPSGTTTPAKYSVPYQDVTLVTSDQTKLAAWWLQHASSDKRPVLVYCHGNGATLSKLAHVAAMFYKFGWDVLLFDYRHYGNSQQGPSGLTEAGVHLDAQAAYDWIRAKGIPETEIIIWGHSLGSSFAAWLASQNHPAGLVLEGAFPSAYSMARFRYPWLIIPKFLVRDKLATGRYVASGDYPLLIIHAQNDTIVPLRMGQDVFELAYQPKELLIVPDIDHNDFPSVSDKYKARLVEMANGWIK